MRQGPNPKWNRNRHRKPHNLSNKTMDSNGPDVKIRGTSSHICKKYQLLARDAQAAGDRIRAENYLQHAEHYYRIVMAAQPPQETSAPQPQPQPAGQDPFSPAPPAAPRHDERENRRASPRRARNGHDDDVNGSAQPFESEPPSGEDEIF